MFTTVPSIRFFDGRGANKPWLAELPDPLSKVSWQTVLWAHPEDLASKGIKQGNIVRIGTKWGQLDAAVYETEGVRQGVFVMNMGQGHKAYGRYAEQAGVNPMSVLSPEVDTATGGPLCFEAIKAIQKTGKTTQNSQISPSITTKPFMQRTMILNLIYGQVTSIIEKPIMKL